MGACVMAKRGDFYRELWRKEGQFLPKNPHIAHTECNPKCRQRDPRERGSFLPRFLVLFVVFFRKLRRWTVFEIG